MSSFPLPEIVYGLETPYPLQPRQNYVRLEGWALIRHSSESTVTRLRIGDTLHEPESRSVRTDVADQFKDDPNAADSGFIFICYLPFGTHVGHLEASADGGTSWHIVKSMMMPVSSHPMMGQFEPAGELGRISEEVRLAGWCWHPEQTIKDVSVLMGDIVVPTEFGLKRPDVATRFPDQPAARHAGFITKENLPRGRGRIRLKARTICGRTYFIESELQAEITNGAFLPSRQVGNLWSLLPNEVGAVPPVPDEPIGAGPTNILFVLFGDFASNSANHVTALANELIALGFDCIVAAPDHPETIEAQPTVRFLPITFAELGNLAAYFRDHCGPSVTHIWTPRECVRRVWEDIERRFSTDLVIHLEDNERELLRNHLKLSEMDLTSLSATELDQQVPSSLSHPVHATAFLSSANGVTTIIDSLQGHVPAEVPRTTFWPAATAAFGPRDLNLPLRRKLGILDTDTVLFYHGNVHDTNVAEMLSLYQAVAELNETDHPTWLLRTGRDSDTFKNAIGSLLSAHLINIGFVKRAKDLPVLMSAANIFVQPGAPGAFNDFRFPSKLPEFFAIGRPVILPSSNLGKVVKHGIHAWVLDAANASEIAGAIRKISRDEELGAALSEGALAFSQQHFSWSKSGKSLRDFYIEHTRLRSPSDGEKQTVAFINSLYAKNVGLT